MSDIIDPLGTIAEFSIGLAGFAGIVAALSRSSHDQLELRLFRFTNLLITAFAPGFFSILSICLIYSGVETIQSIQVSSFALLLYLGAWMILIVKTTPAKSVGRFILFFMWTLAITNILLQATNLVSPNINLVGFYLFGLLVLLLQAAIVFSALALDAIRNTVDA